MDNEETVIIEDEINTDETYLDDDSVQEPEDEKDWKAEALKLQAILDRKTKKAAQAPKAEEPKETDTTPIKQPEFLTREEGILIANGVDEEAIAQLHAISKGKGISLIEAKADPLFEAYEKQKREEKRRADAKLGASDGSGKTPKGKPISEMTKEEHEAYWREKNGL